MISNDLCSYLFSMLFRQFPLEGHTPTEIEPVTFDAFGTVICTAAENRYTPVKEAVRVPLVALKEDPTNWLGLV